MPKEYEQLNSKPEPFDKCPFCSVKPFASCRYSRGLVQRSKRFLGFLWRQKYCCVICEKCLKIVGYEDPEDYDT